MSPFHKLFSLIKNNMNLQNEVKFILQGGNREDLIPHKDGRLKESVLEFLEVNQIPY